MPEKVQDEFGYALHLAQGGGKHPNAKPLKGQGFTGAGVLEVVDNFHGDTYRAVYTVRFANAVYVLHCFQKKSTQGIATQKHEIELIKSRLNAVENSLGGPAMIRQIGDRPRLFCSKSWSVRSQ